MSMLNVWQDPFADVEALVRSVFGPTPERAQGWTPASEVFREGDDAVVRMELPGVDPASDVHVEIERGHLVIRGERRQTRTDEQHGGIREMRYGSFRRVFRLPDHITPEDLSATYDAGLLTVRVKGAHTPPKPVTVSIATGTPAAAAVTAESSPASQPATTESVSETPATA
jgi:HSP20 family protein